jgi:hypothetical protein
MRFTSEFGMGSGGATSLKRLEDSGAVCEQSLFRFQKEKLTVNNPAKRDTNATESLFNC